MSNPSCTIIGASHAAASLALSLRQGGWEGRIMVLGEESDMPYQRPPLSKDVLAGAKTTEMIQIRPAALYEKSDIEFFLGARVEQIDRENKLLRLSDGKHVHYDKLALTLGSRARTIPLEGSDLEGVFYL
ncbi:MAG: FAD-dependent oxidoreductase, partial [Planctomycetales bacterium]